uniref:Putative secreted protein n=1 Tax=Anopheles marajoara TaxID=58244 RepID=A0A2M4C8R9_9DIPT
MRASRCLCASVTVARLYGLSSSVPNPGIHMFQLRSRCSWTSRTSTFGTFRCFASRQAALTVFSTKSSAICSNSSSTSSSSCSVGSISRTSSCRRGLVRS